MGPDYGLGLGLLTKERVMNDLFEVKEKTTVITKKTKFDKTERNNYICKMYDISFDEIVDEFMINFETDFDWNIGLIVGQSGTGKTTIAKEKFKDFYLYISFFNTL